MTGKKIEWDKYSLKIGEDEERIFLIGGEFHYWRVPDKERWLEILKSYKGAGLNCIRVYFHWGFHSPNEGIYNFDDNRDIDYLLKICEEIGLYVLTAIGPYSCAESNAGGYPTWLLQKKEINIRHMKGTGRQKFDENYMYYCKQWYSNVISKIKPHQITENPDGCVILCQIENEYPKSMAGLKGQPEYMQGLKNYVDELGITVPTYHNDVWEMNSWEDIVDLTGFDKYTIHADKEPKELPLLPWSTKQFAQKIDKAENNVKKVTSPLIERPMFIPELQGGWFNHWGIQYGYDELYDFYGSKFQKLILQSSTAQRVTMAVLYMFYGGTNYGNIANPEVYTSYDYSACIREYGFLSNKYKEVRQFSLFVKSFKDSLCQTDPVETPNLKCKIKDIFYKQRLSPYDGTDYYFFRNFNKENEEFSITLMDKKKEDGKIVEGTIVPKLGTQKLIYNDGFIAIGNHAIDGFRIKFCSLPILVKSPYEGGTLLIVIQNSGELLLEGTGFKTEGYINAVKDVDNFTRFSLPGEGYDTITSVDGKKLFIIFLKPENALTLNAEFNNEDINVIWGPYASYFNKKGKIEIETIGLQDVKLITSSSSVSDLSELKEVHVPGVKYKQFGEDIKLPEIIIDKWNSLNTDWLNKSNDDIWKEIDINNENNPLDYGFSGSHVLYKCEFNPGTGEQLKLNTDKPTEIKITLNTRHKTAIWANNQYIGKQNNYNVKVGKVGAMNGPDFSNRGKSEFILNSEIVPREKCKLLVLTENLGYNKHFFPTNDVRNPRGILSAKFNKKFVESKWYITGIDITKLTDPYKSSGLPGETKEYNKGMGDSWKEVPGILSINPNEQIKWFKTKFNWNLDEETRLPIRICLEGNHNVNIFLNGNYIGRYWGEVGPQNDFYLMDKLLQAENTLVLCCWTTEKDESELKVEIKPYTINPESGNIDEKGIPFITKKKSIDL
ncbi:MAG: hypothetical protein GY870_12770 [archaeon]|nr:hypothetical protein [archaeon]